MEVDHLTPTAENILVALAEYRYLTPKQMIALGVTKNKSHVDKTLQSLNIRKPAIVGKLDFGRLPGKGRLSVIHYLTAQGAALLEEARRDLIPVSFPKRVHKFRNDYYHRTNTADLHIAISKWTLETEAELDFLHTYYDQGIKKAGSNFARTRVKLERGSVFVPDIVFKQTVEATTRLFVVEMYNGKETKRVEKQLLLYCRALNEEAIENTFDYEHAVRLLCVFDKERSMELVQERFTKNHPELAGFDELIFFKPLSAIGDFQHGWRRLFSPGEMVSLF